MVQPPIEWSGKVVGRPERHPSWLSAFLLRPSLTSSFHMVTLAKAAGKATPSCTILGATASLSETQRPNSQVEVLITWSQLID